ncbi:protein of unknown function [Bradyrhizobium vignae]|uniref:Uncharacterized protein n=1 Tax=Bradyrhizobium vignae TaxID=1549949 RepID=A0A2U3PX29_9BRAD|nr:protein of unknown function [Bradyrhizobium vignae]
MADERLSHGKGRAFERCAAPAWVGSLDNVMAGLVPAIHALFGDTKNVDARDKPGMTKIANLSGTTRSAHQLTRFQV